MSKKALPDYFQLDHFNISPLDIVRCYLHCEHVKIHPKVILMPNWKADIFGEQCEVQPIVEGILYAIHYKGQAFSLIRSGIGAPQTGEIVLALACTPCKEIIFTGSIGGLLPGMSIGDLLLPTQSISGDGFSRFLEPDINPPDMYGCPAHPDENLRNRLQRMASDACQLAQIPLHMGTVFSTDSILSQFFRLEEWVNHLGCIGVEMETAAAFRASNLVGIRMAALLQISDVPVIGKSVFNGRSSGEEIRRREIRLTILSRIILDTLVET